MTKATHKRNHVIEVLLTVLESWPMTITAEKQEDKNGAGIVAESLHLIHKLQQGVKKGRRMKRERERGK